VRQYELAGCGILCLLCQHQGRSWEGSDIPKNFCSLSQTFMIKIPKLYCVITSTKTKPWGFFYIYLKGSFNFMSIPRETDYLCGEGFHEYSSVSTKFFVSQYHLNFLDNLVIKTWTAIEALLRSWCVGVASFRLNQALEEQVYAGRSYINYFQYGYYHLHHTSKKTHGASATRNKPRLDQSTRRTKLIYPR